MEAVYFSKESVNHYRTTRSYIPEDNIIISHRCDDIKSNIMQNGAAELVNVSY
jgi:hypothetical protein